MFSGVPDPEWTVAVTDPDYLDVQTRLNNAMQNGLVYQPEDLPAILGYKGFLVAVHNMKKKKSVVQGEAEERLIVGPVTVELQKRLFKPMPKGLLPETLRENITKVIASGVVKPQVAQNKTKRYAPPFVTAPWVTRNRQLNNNCYNYATTIITGTFARPGRASNNPFNAITPLNVLLSAMGDGLVPLLPGGPVPVNPPLPNQNHVVALVVWPGFDFHWYRLDNTGRWSHKPGQTRITEHDNAGNLINDPRAAAMLGYQFVTFMTVNRNNVNIN